MRMRFVLFVFALLPLAAIARSVEVPTLAPSAFADTESVTNVVFDAGGGGLREFTVRLAANATASNNVQIAFGTDMNADGVLEPSETDVVIGWDCGAWFLDDERADWSRRWPQDDGVRTLALAMVVKDRHAQRLAVTDGGRPLALDCATLPPTLFDSGWNYLRVTSRGMALRDETVNVKLSRTGFALEVR